MDKDKLIKLQEEYIGLLQKAHNAVFPIAHIHSYRESDEVIAEGKRLREEIKKTKTIIKWKRNQK